MNIAGVWALEAFDIENLEKINRSWGKNVRGLLQYSETGHVSVAINKDMIATNNADKDALDAILFYAGTYTVEGDLVRHQVTVASNPNRVGKEMLRFAKLDGNRLTLTTPQESYGIATLIWTRV